MVQITVPQMGESITEGVIAKWLKSEGDSVGEDEPVVEVETDKITVEVPSPQQGVLSKQSVSEGDTVSVGDVLGEIDEQGQAKGKKSKPKTDEADKSSKKARKKSPKKTKGEGKAEDQEAADDQEAAEDQEAADDQRERQAPRATSSNETPMPAARAEAERRGIALSDVKGTGRGGRILKQDVLDVADAERAEHPAESRSQAPLQEERKAMSPLRRRVAERLVNAQQTAAILTTFNEVDMSAVIGLRQKFRDQFQQRYGIKLGFMSFFVKAAVEALREFPSVNAEIDGDEVIYKYHYDIGVAVGGGKGLVVPVIRQVDSKSFATIEQDVVDYATRAKNNKLKLEELSGGTFTISNGGVYGSMLSTPILNPPQTGILGLHNIVQRPVVIEGRVEPRPVMYLALSYDHRLVDGREAVQFLVRIKECIEDPERLLLEV